MKIVKGKINIISLIRIYKTSYCSSNTTNKTILYSSDKILWNALE